MGRPSQTEFRWLVSVGRIWEYEMSVSAGLWIERGESERKGVGGEKEGWMLVGLYPNSRPWYQ